MKLTVCTKVKYGIKTLPLTILQNKLFADEYIIVDTGSKDGTLNYLDHFKKDKKLSVHQFATPNDSVDFAAFRNEAIRLATGDWILFLDADEFIEPVVGNEIKNVISRHKGVDAFSLNFANFIEPPMYVSKAKFIRGEALRLFKNKDSLKYTGIIHEQPEGYKKTAALPLLIQHLQYFESEKIEAKTIQYKKLMSDKIEKEGYNFNNYMYMGDIYRRKFMWQAKEGDLDQAIDYFSQAIDLEKDPKLMITLSQLIEIKKQIKEEKDDGPKKVAEIPSGNNGSQESRKGELQHTAGGKKRKEESPAEK